MAHYVFPPEHLAHIIAERHGKLYLEGQAKVIASVGQDLYLVRWPNGEVNERVIYRYAQLDPLAFIAELNKSGISR